MQFTFDAESSKQISHYGLSLTYKVKSGEKKYLTNFVYGNTFSQFIFPGSEKSLDIRQADGQYEAFTVVEKTTKHNLAKILGSENSVITKESLLAGALAMALCYIARLQRIKPPGAKVI